MKICIDITPLAGAKFDKGGVYRYIQQLVGGLARIDQKNEYRLFANLFRSDAHQRFQREGRAQLPAQHNIVTRVSRVPGRIWQNLHMPARTVAGAFDVFHGCFDSLPPMSAAKGVVTIHDVRYLEDFTEEINNDWIDILKRRATPARVYLQDYQARFGLFDRLKRQMPSTLTRASKIITVSQFSKDRIVEKLGIDPDRVAVVYHGIDHRPFQKRSPAPSGSSCIDDRRGPYILYAGKFDPLKNLFGVVHAFREVLKHRPESTLVLAGPHNWYSFIVLEEVERLGLLDKVIFTGYVNDEELGSLYRSATLFIMPSFYEGFGMPLLEAMAQGAPVVSSTAASLPEIAGDAALLRDPSDIEGLASAMMSIMDRAVLRTDLIRRGFERAAQFTWDRAARATLKVYETVHERKQ